MGPDGAEVGGGVVGPDGAEVGGGVVGPDGAEVGGMDGLIGILGVRIEGVIAANYRAAARAAGDRARYATACPVEPSWVGW